jgi:hypothetical protein
VITLLNAISDLHKGDLLAVLELDQMTPKGILGRTTYLNWAKMARSSRSVGAAGLDIRRQAFHDSRHLLEIRLRLSPLSITS